MLYRDYFCGWEFGVHEVVAVSGVVYAFYCVGVVLNREGILWYILLVKKLGQFISITYCVITCPSI